MPESASTGARAPFGARLAQAMDQAGPLCVGIDPHAGLLDAWGLPDTAEGLRAFALTTVEAVAGRVAAVKPQSAFFERHGAAGIGVLEETLAAARAAGLLTILDVKRGDIGSTMGGYAQAYLADGAPLAADAITVAPYLGFGSRAPAREGARATGRGLFVLALTSNPEGVPTQHAVRPDGLSVAADIAAAAARANAGQRPMGSVGLVVGATIGDGAREAGVDLEAVNGAFLAPGYGAQGAGPEDVARVFGSAVGHVLVASSRQILGAGPDPAALARKAGEVAVQLHRELGR
ncbi:MAG: orotidine-5'-phosphate decarboxylase [Bifidobacteriaceae bacterium]|jgi:orotidine-5'-phosphate decarboxylase|nr:orotidine-5'-phosphate decarboxylase [Bifidobacteriaceae bacterium]